MAFIMMGLKENNLNRFQESFGDGKHPHRALFVIRCMVLLDRSYLFETVLMHKNSDQYF
jgi:hypothetical protein